MKFQKTEIFLDLNRHIANNVSFRNNCFQLYKQFALEYRFDYNNDKLEMNNGVDFYLIGMSNFSLVIQLSF